MISCAQEEAGLSTADRLLITGSLSSITPAPGHRRHTQLAVIMGSAAWQRFAILSSRERPTYAGQLMITCTGSVTSTQAGH